MPLDDDARPKEEIIAQACAALGHRLPTSAARPASAFLRLFAKGLSADDMLSRPPEDLAGAALSLWDFAYRREVGTARVRVFNPRAETHGWHSAHSVAEIVTDDMPFLVDSVIGALNRREKPVALIVHPIVPVLRDSYGALTDLGVPGQPETIRESMIQVEFAAEGDPAVLAEIETALRQALADVRVAVGDFHALRGKLKEAEAELAKPPSTIPAQDAAVAREFLQWMHDDNFVLLGYRRYRLAGEGAIETIEAESLGLLRDHKIPVFDVLRDAANLPPAVAQHLVRPMAVEVNKANMRSTVHRTQHCDTVTLRDYDAAGKVVGGRLFIGLFAAAAYNRSPRAIPILREKVAETLRLAGFDPASHDGRALTNILDTYPRDELFQISTDDLLRIARGILALQERARLALFLRQDKFERFVSAILFLPRDRLETRLRKQLGEMLARAFGGRLSTHYTTVGDGLLARIHYIIATTPGATPRVDVRQLERTMAEAARSFRDRLAEALAAEHGEAEGLKLLSRWGEAFPASYQERHVAHEAVGDIARAEEALAGNRLVLSLARPPGQLAGSFMLRLFHPARPVPLSDILPIIETLGVRALEEVPHHLHPAGASNIVIHDFLLRTGDGAQVDIAAQGALLRDALQAMWSGAAEADGFNRLVLAAGLTWREVWVLRALFKWLKQIGFAFSQPAVEAALAAHPRAARLMIELFLMRFDPARDFNKKAEAALLEEWAELLDAVANPDEDRILARMMNALQAVVRTNYFQPASHPAREGSDRSDQSPKPYIAFKIDSARVDEMPLPRPVAEIWVHSPRVEGCHLRGGRVARGGIRWSDRREDFRTEILGLMKAQMVKNVVIVPVGAKGGFVLKRPPTPTGDATTDREATQQEGIACYRILISAMLDLTDNARGNAVRSPPLLVRRDEDDPYIVAAADKGTATFSDIANQLSADYGFWLADAFASGGSQGYDHKRLAVTARGAWVCIARHFREMGRDIMADPFTVAGVGDMSGDVFGNGMLQTAKARLIAAFDHRHIFIDPDPDGEKSMAERQRLAKLPRSSWADYDAALISKGGGVFPRTAKMVTLSPEARKAIGLEAERATPAEIMRAILKAEVDLLWFGGIGTFIKASHESHAEAGDRGNDAIRVDGAELRCKVVGEGANLGVTQAGRIEYALQGGRINTDALDNSAGVDTSDHEVNIKILLADLVSAGDMTEKQRNQLLAEMAGDVAGLVLRNNYTQSLAVTLDVAEGPAGIAGAARLMAMLERAGKLDRRLAGLPDAKALATRAAARQGITRPEASVLMSHAKLWLNDFVAASALPDDPALAPELVGYFPPALRERFAPAIPRHRLRRELIATVVTNDIINRMGAAALARLIEEAGASPAEAVQAAYVARETFGIAPLWAEIEALDPAVASGKMPAAAQTALFAALRRLMETGALWFLREGAARVPVNDTVASFRPSLAALAASLAAEGGGAAEAYMREGVPAALAARVAAAERLALAPDIVRLATSAELPVPAAGTLWFAVGEGFALDPLRRQAAELDGSGPWAGRAAAALADDLGLLHRRLAEACLREAGAPRDPEAARAAVETFRKARAAQAERAAALAAEAAAGPPDLAALMVAVRALNQLAG